MTKRNQNSKCSDHLQVLNDINELLNIEGPFTEVAERVLEIGVDHLEVEHGHLTRITV